MLELFSLTLIIANVVLITLIAVGVFFLKQQMLKIEAQVTSIKEIGVVVSDSHNELASKFIKLARDFETIKNTLTAIQMRFK